MRSDLGITREEWLEELAQIELDQAMGAKTTAEWASDAGRGVQWMRAHLRRGLEAGIVELVYVQRERISGHTARVPAYRLRNNNEKVA